MDCSEWRLTPLARICANSDHKTMDSSYGLQRNGIPVSAPQGPRQTELGASRVVGAV